MIIYRITNKTNGNQYIGQTLRTLSVRINEHKYESSVGTNYPLYNAIRKYGFNNFVFEKIDIAKDVNSLNDLEQYYIEYFNTLKPNGYNLNLGGGNKSPSEETRKKMSESAKNKPAMSKETLLKFISSRIGKKNSESHNKKISEAQIGEKNHMFGKIGENNPNFGRKSSKETCEKISKSKKGKKNPNLGLSKRKKIFCLNNNQIYDSVKIASLNLPVSRSGIAMVARGELKQMNGYQFKYL